MRPRLIASEIGSRARTTGRPTRRFNEAEADRLGNPPRGRNTFGRFACFNEAEADRLGNLGSSSESGVALRASMRPRLIASEIHVGDDRLHAHIGASMRPRLIASEIQKRNGGCHFSWQLQ